MLAFLQVSTEAGQSFQVGEQEVGRERTYLKMAHFGAKCPALIRETSVPEVEVHLRTAPAAEMARLPSKQAKGRAFCTDDVLTIFWKSKQPLEPSNQHKPFLFTRGFKVCVYVWWGILTAFFTANNFLFFNYIRL